MNWQSLPARRMRAVFGFVVLSLVLPRAAAACSMCRCSDPVFSALGEGPVYARRLPDRPGLEPSGPESGRRGPSSKLRSAIRSVATMSYGGRSASRSWPRFLIRSITSTGGRDGGTDGGWPGRSGLLRVRATLVLEVCCGTRTPRMDLGDRHVKTPWGKNDGPRTANGSGRARAAGHGRDQPVRGAFRCCTSSTRSPRSMPPPRTRAPGRNQFGYKYGNNVQANPVYDRKLTDWLDGVFEVNFLDAKRDQSGRAGVRGPTTGGQTLYVTPRVGVNVVARPRRRAAAAQSRCGRT